VQGLAGIIADLRYKAFLGACGFGANQLPIYLGVVASGAVAELVGIS
jgi:hypothetical protein